MRITDWCDEMGIKNYIICNDVINVDGDVMINEHHEIDELPFKFGMVTGIFDVSFNHNLSSFINFPDVIDSLLIQECGYKSLKGCPKVNIEFNCSLNLLVNLIGGPNPIRHYNCSHCSLETLEGIPNSIYELYADYNHLTSLKYCPQNITHLMVTRNDLRNLQYCPEYKVGNLYISHNSIESLQYCPKIIENDLDVGDNPNLRSLVGIGKVNGDIYTDLKNDPIYLKHVSYKKFLYG